MRFYENRLADDSLEMSSLTFSEKKKDCRQIMLFLAL